MNVKTMTFALGLALSAVTISASAQKSITEGYSSFTTEIQGQPADVKAYFKPDSSATLISFGAGNVKVLMTAKHDYLAVVLDIPVAQLKKAGIATPAELEDAAASLPTFSFTPATETKTISGFACKKVVAKDNKSGKTYDVWITNDISVPATAVPFYYSAIGGYPVKFTSFQKGQDGSLQETDVTVTSVTAGKAPAGTYAIAKDFERGSLADLHP
jgi:hypothetical protein